MARDKHTFQLKLQLDDEEANALLRLMKQFETTDVSDVLAGALRFQDLCLNATASGHELLCRDANGDEYVIDLGSATAGNLH